MFEKNKKYSSLLSFSVRFCLVITSFSLPDLKKNWTRLRKEKIMIKSALITICRSEGELGELKLQPKQYTCAHSFTEDINSSQR